MRKIFVVGNSVGYANWMQGELVNTLKEADLVVFTGGEDVHPDFYGHPEHPKTYTDRLRDRAELKIFEEAVKLNIHIIGICRGSQLLCVANGGVLVQHQHNPAYIHEINTFDGQKIDITSTHHQAAFPYLLPKENYKVLGWTDNICKFHEDGNRMEMNPEKECEIVWYPKNKCLGIQGHPEALDSKHPTIAYLRDLLDKFITNKIHIQNEQQTTIQQQATFEISA